MVKSLFSLLSCLGNMVPIQVTVLEPFPTKQARPRSTYFLPSRLGSVPSLLISYQAGWAPFYHYLFPTKQAGLRSITTYFLPSRLGSVPSLLISYQAGWAPFYHYLFPTKQAGLRSITTYFLPSRLGPVPSLLKYQLILLSIQLHLDIKLSQYSNFLRHVHL